MSEKHRIFVESMVKMGKAVPEYVQPLKSITKSYIINEGIDEPIRRYMNKAKSLFTNEPKDVVYPKITNCPLSNEELDLLNKESKDFKSDYMSFQTSLKELIFHLNTFGDEAYIRYIMSPAFDNALAQGAKIDALRKRARRPHPLSESIDKTMRFLSVLESIDAMGYHALAKSVHDTYMQLENDYGLSTRYIVESMFDDIEPITEMVKTPEQKIQESNMNNRLWSITMPNIARFIAKHGRWAWDRFLQQTQYKFAMNRAEAIRKG